MVLPPESNDAGYILPETSVCVFFLKIDPNPAFIIATTRDCGKF
jgi:hypothetical protein